ncbi:AccI family restriction endonuclease [Microcystis aeruginosa]|uniref:AccI family restriction endonuclease n=1 Tax=Microcystis aeruginosa TaxID=1126 RepID=UPI001F4F59FC|nr:AccI family restriction endonuclease [Microcystis aeruginosa]
MALVSNDNNDGNNFSIERDVKNQGKTTIKINGQIGKEVIGKIDMPEHKSALEELDRGRLLFYVTFAAIAIAVGCVPRSLWVLPTEFGQNHNNNCT